MEIYSTIKSMWRKVLACCLLCILCLSTCKVASYPLIPFIEVCKLLWDFLKKCRLSIENSLNCLLRVNVICLLKSLEHPLSPVLLTNSFEWRALKKLWIYLSRKIFSNHGLSIVLVIFLEMAYNPFIPFTKVGELLGNFNLLEIMSTSVKGMCREILVCCLLGILCLSICEMASNPFVPFSKVCKLLRDFTLLEIDHTAFKRMWSKILACCLLGILSIFTCEVSDHPFIPFTKISKLLWDLSFLKKLWWHNLSF